MLGAFSSKTYFGRISQSIVVNGQPVTTVGPGSFIVPEGVTTLKVESWGGGGGSMGQDNTQGASSGGAYARSNITVTPGQTVYFYVGTGGLGGQSAGLAGGNSWVNSSTNSAPSANTAGVKAVGGSGAPVAAPNNGTQLANSVGEIIYIGGAGGGGYEGGGGGAASSQGNGNAGANGNGGIGGNAGTGGGAGGSAGSTTNNGGDGISNVEGGGGGGGSYNHRGGMGGAPGGAGGAGWSTGSVAPTSGVNTNPHGYGGDGARGQVRISW